MKSLIIIISFVFAWNLHAEPVESQFARVLEHASEGHYAQAIEALKQHVGNTEKEIAPYLLLADYYWYHGNLDAGRNYFLQEIAHDSTNPHLYLGLARVAQHNASWADVFAHSKHALELESTVPEAIVLLIASALQMDDTRELPGILKRLQKSEQQSHLYELGYAFWRYRIDNLRSAQNTINAYLKEHATDAFGHLLAGLISGARGQVETSGAHLRRADGLLDQKKITERIRIYERLGSHYFNTDKPDSSRYYFLKAENLAKRSGALKQQFDLSRAAIPFYRELKLYDRAADASETAIKIADKLGLQTDMNSLLYERALAHEKMHDYDRAIRYYSNLQLKLDESTDELAARINLNLGRIFFDIKDWDAALNHLDKCQTRAKQKGWSDLEHTALLKKADVYHELERFEEADDLYRDVLRYSQWTQQHHITERCFLKLAHLYLDPANRNLDHAYYFLSLADALARQTVQLQYAAKHRWMEGRIALLEKDDDEEGKNIERAEMLFLDAVQLGKEAGSYISILAGHAGLVRTYLRSNFPKLARDHADSTLYYLDFCSDYAEEWALEFFDLKTEVFEPMLRAYSKVGNLEKIYDTCERYKAFMHAEAIEQAKYNLDSPPLDSLNWELTLFNKRIKDRWQKLWGVWDDYKDQIDLSLAIKHEIKEMRIEQRQHLSLIARNHPDYYALIKPVPLPLPRLQSHLGKLNATFLHYMVTENATFIIVVTPASLECKRINITRPYLDDRIKGLSPLFNGARKQASQMDTFRMDHAAELYRMLFEPVRSSIPEGHKVIVSADGIINKLPFETLVSNPEALTDEYDYVHARFLIEDYVFSYIPFARFLEASKKRYTKTERILLAFANSDLPREFDSTNGDDRKNGVSATLRDRVAEIERITATIGENETRVYLEPQATKENFIQESGQYQIIHLAVPAVLNGIHPLYSKIQFADSDYLNAADLFRLDLNASSVVLSASKGTEGKYSTGLNGLLHGLYFAGVPTLLSTRWEAPDHSEIITTYYENLMDGMEQAEALQQARVTFLNTHDRNPYHWAALTLNGNPGEIRIRTHEVEFIVVLTCLGVLTLAWGIVVNVLKMRREGQTAQDRVKK